MKINLYIECGYHAEVEIPDNMPIEKHDKLINQMFINGDFEDAGWEATLSDGILADWDYVDFVPPSAEMVAWKVEIYICLPERQWAIFLFDVDAHSESQAVDKAIEQAKALYSGVHYGLHCIQRKEEP